MPVHAATPLEAPKLDVVARQALLDMWTVYDAHFAEVSAVLLESFIDHPVLGPLIAMLPQAHREADAAAARERLRRALVQDDWLPYLDALALDGVRYAAAGFELKVWYEVVSAFRRAMLPVMLTSYAHDQAKLSSGLHGIGLLLDIAMPRIAQAYFDTMHARLECQAAELKSMNFELARANAELAEVAHAASHDLLAPLRAIDNLLAWLDGSSPMPEDMNRERLFELLQSRTRRMRGMVDGLREYARAGRTAEDQEKVDLQALFTEVVALADAPPGFRIVACGPLPRVQTVRVPLRHVLLNLITNAIKHHDRTNGNVEVIASRHGNSLILDVRDDGPGIDPRFAERIFKMFETLRSRDEVEASGVGLAIVKKWAEAIGGSVVLVPGQGRGATFRLTWPVAAFRGNTDDVVASRGRETS